MVNPASDRRVINRYNNPINVSAIIVYPIVAVAGLSLLKLLNSNQVTAQNSINSTPVPYRNFFDKVPPEDNCMAKKAPINKLSMRQIELL